MPKKPPELTFQSHVAEFLKRVHRYPVMAQESVTDTENFLAEDYLWQFITETQPDSLKKLAEYYGSDARAELFRALKSALNHTPLWLVIRNGLDVRGQVFHLYYPRPRSSASVAARL